MVKIIKEECFCFNTKQRAPYKIVFETINMNEQPYLIFLSDLKKKYNNYWKKVKNAFLFTKKKYKNDVKNFFSGINIKKSVSFERNNI